MNDLVSVIVPVYNVEKKLDRCIDSIVKQTYRNIEIILVDDGSIDLSGKICDYYGSQDSRVVVYHQKNCGVSEARNQGLNLATGKYICFIDSDDYVENNYVEKLYDLIMIKDVDLGVCNINYIYSNGLNHEVSIGINIIDFSSISRKTFLELNKKYLLYSPYNKIFKSRIIKENQIRFPSNISYGEDLIFNLKYLKYVKMIKYSRGIRYNYIADTENSLSNKYRKERFENGEILYKELYSFFKLKNMLYKDSEEYLYERIFDDAYNSLCEVVRYENRKEAWKCIGKILNNQNVKNALQCIDTEKYSSQIVSFMKNNNKKLLYIYIKISNFKNGIKK